MSIKKSEMNCMWSVTKSVGPWSSEFILLDVKIEKGIQISSVLVNLPHIFATFQLQGIDRSGNMENAGVFLAFRLLQVGTHC